MRTSVDITAKYGTMSLVSTTWADTKATKITRKDTRSNEQDYVGNICCLHINFLVWLHHINIDYHLTYSSIFLVITRA